MSPSRKRSAPAAKRRGRAARTPARKPAARRSAGASRSAPSRADFGASIDGFLAEQPPGLRAILDALRGMIGEAAPEATPTLKWGIPWFVLGGELMCALGAHRAHVNLILPGPPGTYADPAGRLEGESKNGTHLKLTTMAELPRADVRRWVRAAAARARSKAGR